MIETPDRLIETPDFSVPVPGPHGGDVLSDVLRRFRVTGAALLRGEYSAPWAWEAPGARTIGQHLHSETTRLVIFHIVADGRCWLEVEGQDRQLLTKGDLVGFPHGHAHRMGCGEGARPYPLIDLFPPRPWSSVPTIRQVDGDDICRLLCVYLRCEDLLFDPVMPALPSLIVVRPGRRAEAGFIDAAVRHLIAEAGDGRPGSACLTARLTEIMFIEVLRLHIAGLGSQDRGWLAALNDSYVARALHLFHEAPDHGWSIASICAEVGLSRSALNERFQRLLGMSPMRYLTLWRLQLAAQQLMSTNAPLSAIAHRSGYGSEEAFSRAFKRVAGVAPAEWRSTQRARRADVAAA